MAKAKKADRRPEEATPATPPRVSVLEAAYQRLEAGDVVEARRLARAVLDGVVGPGDADAARQLEVKMRGNELVPVEPTVEGVARAILQRSAGVPRAYLFAAATATLFVGLVLIAWLRYG